MRYTERQGTHTDICWKTIPEFGPMSKKIKTREQSRKLLTLFWAQEGCPGLAQPSGLTGGYLMQDNLSVTVETLWAGGRRAGTVTLLAEGLRETGSSTTNPNFTRWSPSLATRGRPYSVQTGNTHRWLAGLSLVLQVRVCLLPTATPHTPSEPPPSPPPRVASSPVCVIHSSPCLDLSSPYLP